MFKKFKTSILFNYFSSIFIELRNLLEKNKDFIVEYLAPTLLQ